MARTPSVTATTTGRPTRRSVLQELHKQCQNWRDTKESIQIDLVHSACCAAMEGATLDQMVEATGWLPHTTHGADLKRRGHVVARWRS
jgi:hypothetical protein